MSVRIIGILKWVFRIIMAFILLQISFYKLASNPQAIYLFILLDMEPFGRFGIGFLEVAAGLLVLYPGTTAIGALLAAGLMVGAIYFHLFKIGISINGDTTLFTMAVIAFVSSAILVVFEKDKLMRLANLNSKANNTN